MLSSLRKMRLISFKQEKNNNRRDLKILQPANGSAAVVRDKNQ